MNLVQTSLICKICGSEVQFSIHDPSTYLSRRDHESFFGMQLFSFRVQHVIGNERHINSVIVDAKGLYRGHLDAYAERMTAEQDDEGFYLQKVDETKDLPRKPFIFFYLYDLATKVLLEFVESQEINLRVLFSQVLKRIHEFQQLYDSKNFFETEFADLKIQILVDGDLALFFALENPQTELRQILGTVLSRFSNEGFIQISTLILLLHIVCFNEEIDSEILSRLLKTDLIRVQVKSELQDYIPKISKKLAEQFPISETDIEAILQGDRTIYEMILKQPDKYKVFCRMVEFTNRRKLLG